MKYLKQLGETQDGFVVYDRKVSHVDGHPDTKPFILKGLKKIHSQEREFIIECVDFGESVGHTICVPTDKDDDIIFAKRKNRDNFTRFVKNRDPIPCSSIVFILFKRKTQTSTFYILETAYEGKISPGEPWDMMAHSRSENRDKRHKFSIDFWGKHALIYNPNDRQIDHKTLLKEAPEGYWSGKNYSYMPGDAW